MNCSHCGEDNRDGVRFCTNCGKKLPDQEPDDMYQEGQGAAGGSGSAAGVYACRADTETYSYGGFSETYEYGEYGKSEKSGETTARMAYGDSADREEGCLNGERYEREQAGKAQEGDGSIRKSWQKQVGRMEQYTSTHEKVIETLMRIVTAAAAAIYGLWALGSLRGMLSSIGILVSHSLILYEYFSPGYWIWVALRFIGTAVCGAVLSVNLLMLGFRRSADNSRLLQASFLASSLAMLIWNQGVHVLMYLFSLVGLLDIYMSLSLGWFLLVLIYIGGTAFGVELLLYLKKELRMEDMQFGKLWRILPESFTEMKRILKSVW